MVCALVAGMKCPKCNDPAEPLFYGRRHFNVYCPNCGYVSGEVHADRWPATTAFLDDEELQYWLWCYRVWQGSTYHVLEEGKGRWFYTSGANPKWRLVNQ